MIRRRDHVDPAPAVVHRCSPLPPRVCGTKRAARGKCAALREPGPPVGVLLSDRRLTWPRQRGARFQRDGRRGGRDNIGVGAHASLRTLLSLIVRQPSFGSVPKPCLLQHSFNHLRGLHRRAISSQPRRGQRSFAIQTCGALATPGLSSKRLE